MIKTRKEILQAARKNCKSLLSKASRNDVAHVNNKIGKKWKVRLLTKEKDVKKN